MKRILILLMAVLTAAAYGRPVSYAEMIRSLLDYIPETEPDVEEQLDQITTKHPELLEKLGRWGGKETQK